MSSINPKKLKVAELKHELEQRDISIPKGAKKADLLALLLSAMDSEAGQQEFSSCEADESTVSETDADLSTQEESAVPDDPPPPEEPPADPVAQEAVQDEEKPVEEPVQEEQRADDEQEQPAGNEEAAQTETAVQEPDVPEPEQMQQETEGDKDIPQEDAGDAAQAAGDAEQAAEVPEPMEADPPANLANGDVSAHEDEQAQADETAEPATEAEPTEQTSAEVNEAEKEKNEEEKSKDDSKETDDQENKAADSKHGNDHARKRRHDDRPDRQNRWEDRYAPPEEEKEEEFDDNLVVLDIYNSDLNFKVSRERLGGQPLTMEGFAYLWAGARATYGVKTGKICFECKLTDEVVVKHLPSDEPHPHVVRVGWSTDKTSMQLGEEDLSYGFGGTGKASVGCNFTDFGESFRAGDVIGCYLDISAEDNFTISYTKNGKYLGVAFTEEKAKLGNEALFPHILCKNTTIELNFGLREEPYFLHPEELTDYVFISSLSLEDRIRAAKAPETKKDCEVLMMCGLPGVGKTYYATQQIKDSADKKYNVLGTNAIMEKMRVMGVARKKNYAGRWDLLIQNATHCLNRLLQLACRKRRNYILDQTNVYASAQRRKMRPFEGFHRKAIVVVPTEEEYKTRFEGRTKEEGKEVPESAILEMKANFTIPEEGNLFEEVVFSELARPEAEKLVEKYREEARKNGPPPEKRSRGGDGRRHGDSGWGGGGGGGQGRRFRGPPPPPFRGGGGGGWGGFGGGGGFGEGGFGGRGGFGRDGFRGRGGGGFRSGGGGGGGYGQRQGGFGGGGGGRRDFGQGDRRDNNRRDNRGGGGGRDKGGWQNRGFGGGRGGGGGGGGGQNFGGGYGRQNQGRGGGGGFRGGSSGFQYQGGKPANKAPQQNARQGGQQSSAPHSAQSYTYGHHPQHQQQQQQNQQQSYTQNTGYSAGGGYSGYQQANAQTQPAQSYQAPAQQAYQQAYGQPDYSQQWAQYYQQQAQQTQQYQNFYANYQQYYQQAGQQPRQ